MTHEQYEWVYHVSAKITKNGELLTNSTWSSSENFDDCYRKISNYIKRNSTDQDKIVKHIIGASENRYIITEY